MLPSFEVFGLTIPMFGVMMMIGMLAAFILLWFTRRIIRFSEDTLFSAALWAIVLGLLGAKVLYWIVEFDEILADPAYLLQTLRSGFVFYGALLGGALGLLLFSLRKKLPILAFIDLFAPSLVLAQAFGRIGCFCAGCCYGCPTDGSFCVVFPAGSAAPTGVPLLPVQLMESAFLFFLTVLLVRILKKHKVYGTVTGWYLVLYGVWRFTIEFFRTDDRGTVGALSTSQFIAIFLVAAGIALLVLIARGIVSRETLPESEVLRAKKEDEEEEEAEAEASGEEPAEPTGKEEASAEKPTEESSEEKSEPEEPLKEEE